MESDVSTGIVEALGLHFQFWRICGWSEDEIIGSIMHIVLSAMR